MINRGNIFIRGQVRGSIYEGLDLVAAATVVDVVNIGRHWPKLISATRPRRHVAFLDKPCYIYFPICFEKCPKQENQEPLVQNNFGLGVQMALCTTRLHYCFYIFFPEHCLLLRKKGLENCF